MSRCVASVVVPSYGRPRQLRACLDALEGLSLVEPWEVVVVDDGSPEQLAGLADAFNGRLDLRVIRQDNAGPAAARNRGVHEARGTFVAFTDDDCLPDRDWLATLVGAARERPDALVGGTTVNGLPQELFASTSQLIVDLVYEHFNADPDDAYFFASNNMLCRREAFLAMGGFDEEFPRAGAEDRDFCDRWRMGGSRSSGGRRPAWSIDTRRCCGSFSISTSATAAVRTCISPGAASVGRARCARTWVFTRRCRAA